MTATLADKLRRFDPTLPLAAASTIPGLWYTDVEIYERERQKVFLDSWQAVGRVDQVRSPGDFFTVAVAGEPVLVVRGKDGILRAMSNVCRHRAARVECRESGTASRFRCRYHGWAYDLKGRLAGAPEFDGVESFCKEDIGLPAYHVDTWGPLVFVHLGAKPQPLADFLAPLPAMAAGRGVDGLKFVARREYEMRCNWKLFVDNYLDGGYHITTLHPDLAKVVNMEGYRTELFGQSNVQISPLKPAKDANLNAVRSGKEAHYWWVYPNLMLNIYDGVMDTNLVLPLGVDRCICIFDFYFSETDSKAVADYIDKSVAVAHQVQLEDVEICEEVQRGLMSRAYDQGRFSVRREAGGYHFHKMLAAALGAP